MNFKSATLILIIVTIIDIIVMLLTFKTHNITWYLIAVSVINLWLFIPFIFSGEIFFLGISIMSCYFIFDSFWLGAMVGLIWWVIFYDVETIYKYAKLENT